MYGLVGFEILELWDAGEGRPPWQQALLLAARAVDQSPLAEAARLEVGERDRLILGLRERTLARPLEMVLPCPSCAEPVEFAFATADLCADWAAPVRSPVEHTWKYGSFRAPATLDVAATQSAEELFARCAPGAPPEAFAEWEAEIERLDPLADLVLELECSLCGHKWDLPFDATAFFWKELRANARRLIQEVATLAARYGWSEDEILRLSPRRRQLYLDAGASA